MKPTEPDVAEYRAFLGLLTAAPAVVLVPCLWCDGLGYTERWQHGVRERRACNDCKGSGVEEGFAEPHPADVFTAAALRGESPAALERHVAAASAVLGVRRGRADCDDARRGESQAFTAWLEGEVPSARPHPADEWTIRRLEQLWGHP